MATPLTVGSGSAAEPGSRSPRMSGRLATALEYAVVIAAVVYIAVYIVIALQRITFPFDLEWMEGASVDHVRRLLTGQQIYAQPSLDFIPYLYPPLYYYVSAIVAWVMGIGVVPLRLVSFVCSLVCFGLLYMLVRRETGSPRAGLIAVGLFAATFRVGGAWFDIARVDSLALALLLGAVYLARFAERRRAWAAAGLLLALSALTKQTALMIAVPLGVYALIVDWRGALVMTAACVALFGGATLALNASTHGWYLYYTVGLPFRIQQVGRIPASFWHHDVAGAMPVALVAGVGYLASRRAWSRSAIFYLAFTVGFVGSAWLSRIHSGAYDNVLIPAYVCLAVLLALAIWDLPRWASVDHRSAARLFAAAICLLQFVWLAYNVRAQIPTANDRAMATRLIRTMREANGEVYLASHGFFPVLAGKSATAQSWAFGDIMRAGGTGNRRQLAAELHDALATHRFALIILDRMDPWLEPDLDRYYHRAGPVFKTDGLWTATGYHTRPRWIYVPN
jgi:4-amino-4-deoxy-L-arabinose transferase-like glycosyltransferase